jgi:phytoene synthase
LQWWRDVLGGKAAGDAGRNPVAAALIDTLDQHSLPRDVFRAVVDAREFDLYDEPMRTMAAYESYLRTTSSALFALSARVLAGNDAGASNASVPAGLAYGTTGLLRAFAWHASRGQIYLPTELLDHHRADRAGIVGGVDTPALRAVLAEMRGKAAGYLAEARARLGKVGHGARPAFLPLALIESYLARMEHPDYRPFRTPVEVPQWRRQWTLWRAARSTFRADAAGGRFG